MKVPKWLVIFLFFAGSASAQSNQLWKVYYDSTQNFWAKDWVKTVSLLERAERSAISDLGLYDQNYLTILNDLGTAYWKAKEYPKAEQVLTKTLALKSEVYPVSDKEVVLSISNLAGFYAEQGQWRKSKTLYKRILSLDSANIPADIYVTAAQNLVSLYDINQQADSADFLLRKIEKWDFIQVNSFYDFQRRFFRARIHRKLQQHGAAGAELAILVEQLSAYTSPELRELYIQSLQEQGILSLQTGDYSRAEKKLLQAYQLAAAEPGRDQLLTELSNNLAQVYDKLNIYDRALQYYSESLGRCRLSYEEGSLPCVILLNNIAGIHLKQNNISHAITDYKNVIAAFEKLLRPADQLYITSLNNIATAYRKNNQYKQALEYLEKANKLLEKNGLANDDLAATVFNNIAVLKTAQGDYRQAAQYYHRAYEIKRAIYGDRSIVLVDLLNNLAVTYWALNKPSEAIPLFKRSMELATRQVTYVFPNLNENEQMQFYEKLKEDFERFNSIAVQWADKDRELLSLVFQNRTVIKSLQFFTQQRRANNIGTKNDPQLNDLVARLKDRRDRLGFLYQLPLSYLQDESEISALEKEIDELDKSISIRSSEALYGEGLTAEEVSWKALVPKLQSHEAIVEIIRLRKYERQTAKQQEYFGFADSVYYAALILTRASKESPDLVVFKDGNNLETRFYNYYKNAMRYDVEDTLSYDFFWKPVHERLAGKTRVYFSADGVYHKINVNTLREPRTGKFLLDIADIVYLLNPIQVLENKTPPNTAKRTAVLMGDPVFDVDLNPAHERTMVYNDFGELAGTQEELRAINAVLKQHSWTTRVYLKGAATESNLNAVRSPGILHIASHGFFSDEVVTLNAAAKKAFLFHSGIVLSGANTSLASGSTTFENDGIVTAFEVMNLDLTATDLVVLSACETGLGKIENGEGVFGLQRSFMQAGASNVLISLWKVDDNATRDLMIKFYEYLAGGHSLRNSLKKAQSDQSKILSNPSLWGGFILVGN